MHTLKYYLFSLFLFLQAQGLWADEELMPPPPGGSLWQTLMMVAIVCVFFYFILLRPEQRRRKQADAMRNSIKKGDRVTAMGIIGTVSQVKDQTIILRMVDGAKIEFLKGAVTEVMADGTEETPAEITKD